MRFRAVSPRAFALLAVTVSCGLTSTSRAQHDAHAAHRQVLSTNEYRISRELYEVPDVTLTNQHGERLSLRRLLASDTNVAINFIFTTCTTICPVMTATWRQLETELADEAVTPELFSISIDPAYDTPEILHEYATLFGASWNFLTGTEDEIVRTLKRFDASRGSKVNHFALTLMRPAGKEEWTRVEGLTSARDLADVWRSLVQ